MDVSHLCTICDEHLENNTDKVTTVKAKGLATLIKKSKVKDDNKWIEWSKQSCIAVHEGCRKRYGVSRLSTSDSPSHRSTSSDPQPSTSMDISQESTSEFNFTELLCFICGKVCEHRKKSSIVTNSFMTERYVTIAKLRDDEMGEFVQQRLVGVSSLAAVKARYHWSCLKSFSNIPSKELHETSDVQIARTVMDRIFNYIETQGKYNFLLSELKEVMGNDCISNKTLYRHLRTKYGSDIYISSSGGRDTIIYYKKYDIGKIYSKWVCDDASLGEIEKRNVLHLAAGILNAEIMAKEYTTDSYKSPHEFLEGVIEEVPELLTYFVSNVIMNRKCTNSTIDFIKRDQICHSLVSATRSHFQSHFQLAVGNYVYNKSGSRLIIDLLSKLGVSASYYHLQLLEASCIVHSPELRIEDAFVQYVFDNTDHNVSTLDGHRTFHSLGGIAVYTPESELSISGSIKKCQQMPSTSVIASHCNIEIKTFSSINDDAFKNLVYEDTSKLFLDTSNVLPPYYALYLWAHTLSVHKLPSWRGFMEVLSQDTSYSVSKIICLPFINSPPSKLTTINTALHHAREQSNKLNQKHVFVTFDQPLYIKAREIVASSVGQLDNVIIRLGGFHMLMSYLGAIGHVMKESGLEDMWGVVYAPQSVKKMLEGKAFSRALRAHILTFTSLGAEICKNINDFTMDKYKQFLDSFLNNWDDEPPTMGDCAYENKITDMTATLKSQLLTLKNNGPTAKLWVQYFECILVVLQFIEAERLGNWKLHLESVRRMLPLFHAAGHFSYAKSTQIYLQDMVKLEYTMDDKEYYRFTVEGYFTIRRSDKAWSGIWSDMTIEQTLNRFFGTDLKHGRGVTPSVVARYLLCMPTTFTILNSLEDYCNITSTLSEQHVDLTTSRINRDHTDIAKFKVWLHQHEPFKPRQSLTSLSCGVIGAANINCSDALEVGLESMKNIVGCNAANVSLSTRYKVKTLADAKHGIHIDDKYISVDSSLLFQRISVLTQNQEDLLREAFEYELSPFPLALFDKNGYMRKSKKSELYSVFSPTLLSEAFLSTCQFVIDGGFLLHQICWPEASTYCQVFQIYYSHITKHYGSNATVVFDGYSSEIIGTKSYERYCRNEKNIAADVDFQDTMLITMNQSKFLSNICNKHKFVKMLAEYLKSNGLSVVQAEEDADVLIIRTALDLKSKTASPITVVGNDVDLLVLLIALTPTTDNLYFYKVSPQNKKNTLYCTSEHTLLQPFILFAHAFSGCDTTSAFFGKGKKNIIKLLKKQPELYKIVSVFYNTASTDSDILEAAIEIVRNLYGHDKNLSIGQLRYKKFLSLISQTKTEAKLSQLPPTSSALHQHAKRVFYQVQLWLGNVLLPDRWGWKRISMYLFPILNTQEPAPQELLAQISCNCTTNCQTNRCSCRKTGLRCSQFCNHCNGICCSNPSLNSQCLDNDTVLEQPYVIEEEEQDEENELIDDRNDRYDNINIDEIFSSVNDEIHVQEAEYEDDF